MFFANTGVGSLTGPLGLGVMVLVVIVVIIWQLTKKK